MSDETTTAPPEAEGEATAAPADTERKVAHQPDFSLALMDFEEIPEPPQRTRDATNAYQPVIDNLGALANEHPGKWAEVAFYNARPGSEKNPAGARKVYQKIIDGEIKPPETGTAGWFDLEWRKANYNGSGRDGSVLLAKFNEGTPPE